MPGGPSCCGLIGSGLLRNADGTPLRPGGLALTELLLRHAGFSPGDAVLDIGCGQGAGTALMLARGVRAIGIDAAIGPLAFARQHAAAARFVVASGTRLPLRPRSVDGVLAECSLSVMEERRHALAEWCRVLRPGRRIAMSDVYRLAAPGDENDPNPAGMASWQTIAREVCEAGFQVVHFEDRSDVLREWVARFIFAYGSLDPLRSEAGGRVREGGRRAAFGYFIMVASKSVRRRKERSR
jgi:SAM-dependent methyltransferase